MADDAAAVPAENEDLAALGGRELLSAKMELSTAKHDLGAKLAENVGLLRKAEGLKQELETQKADAKDIYFYLHKKLDDNYGEIDVLEKIKVELTDELEQTVERYELQLAEMRVAWEAEVEAGKSVRLLTAEETMAQLAQLKATQAEAVAKGQPVPTSTTLGPPANEAAARVTGVSVDSVKMLDATRSLDDAARGTVAVPPVT